MVAGLERYQQAGDLHFVTFSCYHRLAYLRTTLLRDLFEDALQKAHRRYRFNVVGYVVMPEHVHLLLSEPEKELLASGLQALKLSVTRRTKRRPFWQARYYDFNVFTDGKLIEKLSTCTQSGEAWIGGESRRLALVELPALPNRGPRSSRDRVFLERSLEAR